MKVQNTNRRDFLIRSVKTGCIVLCGSAISPIIDACDTIEEGDPILDLNDYPELKTPGVGIKKRYKKLNNSRPILIIRLLNNKFVAYSAICTHQFVELLLPENGIIVCPNHESKFRITDGEVIQGEAIDPLPSFNVLFDQKTNILKIG